MKKVVYLIIFVIILIILIYVIRIQFQLNILPVNLPVINNNSSKVQNVQQVTSDKFTIIAQNLEIPWALVALPDGEMIFTERKGTVRYINKEGSLQNQAIAQIEQVKHIGEGGLLGIAVHPEYKTNHYVYFYYTYREQNGNTLNRVVRYRFENQSLVFDKIITDKIPGASNHNGGRIKFGPDGYLYIATGDAQEPSRAQDTSSLAGKILRVTDEGKSITDNPFGNEVYSYGHRNVQGLAWGSDGRLWATEHGRSGVQSGLDELNLIEKGKNYGWPEIQGDETKDGMIPPVVHSGKDTWAPSGMAFYNGSVYFGGLRGSALYQYEIKTKKITEHFKGEFGRIREVILGSEGMLYLTTSNRDGRGKSFESDDKIMLINLNDF